MVHFHSAEEICHHHALARRYPCRAYFLPHLCRPPKALLEYSQRAALHVGRKTLHALHGGCAVGYVTSVKKKKFVSLSKGKAVPLL